MKVWSSTAAFSMQAFFRRSIFALFIAFSFHTMCARSDAADGNIYSPPNYTTFQPPASGGSYTDPIFGTNIKRLTNALATPNVDSGGNLIFISDEYSSMSAFNSDNSKILLIHQSYFGLYDG